MVQDVAGFGMNLQRMLSAAIEKQYDFQRKYLCAPQYQIARGSDKIMRNILAKRAPVLPTEQWADKGVPFNKMPGWR